MIQDLLSTDRFRWSLSPTSMVESEHFVSVQWDSLPPTQCGACDGLQGAVLNIAQYVKYPETPPACEEQLVFAECVEFILTFYQIRSRRLVFAEASYATLSGQQLTTPLKICGGGGTTSAVTAISQLLFWKSTSENYTLAGKPFQLVPPEKAIPADPNLCGEPGVDNEPVLTDEPPFPATSRVFLVEKPFSTENNNPEIVSRGSLPISNFYVGLGRLRVTPPTFIPPCTQHIASTSQSTGLYMFNQPPREDSFTAGYSGWHSSGPDCPTDSAFSYDDIYIRIIAPGEQPRDFLVNSLRPPLGPDYDPRPLPPPPPTKCRLWRQVVDVKFISMETFGSDYSIFKMRWKDEEICSNERPPAYSLTELGQLFAQYRVINFEQSIDLIGECDC